MELGSLSTRGSGSVMAHLRHRAVSPADKHIQWNDITEVKQRSCSPVIFEKTKQNQSRIQLWMGRHPREIPLPHGVVVLQEPQTDAEQDFPDRNLNKLHGKFCPKVYNQYFMSTVNAELCYITQCCFL